MIRIGLVTVASLHPGPFRGGAGLAWPCSRAGPSLAQLSAVKLVMEKQIKFDSVQPKLFVEKW